MQQFPSTFQFNERFLLTLHDHVHSCQFGTFIGNCEKDRLDLRLAERTFSLWGYMANHMNEYVNPLYCAEGSLGTVVPNLCPQNIRFWRGMYCRFESGVHPREPQGDLLLATCDHSYSLEDHIKYLTKRITSVKSFISNSADRKKSKLKKNNTMSDIDVTDNKYLYEKAKTMRELEAADDDHPLKIDKKVDSEPPLSPQIQELTKDLESVAVDWKTLRNITECSCSTPFDHFSRKVIN